MMGGPSSIAGKPMAPQKGIVSPYTKFGIDTSMHRRDMASHPVWRVGVEFDWLLRANGSEIKKYTIPFIRLGLQIICVKSRGNKTISLTSDNVWRSYK